MSEMESKLPSNSKRSSLPTKNVAKPNPYVILITPLFLFFQEKCLLPYWQFHSI